MEWFESETFWSDLYPYMFPPERFAVADEQVLHRLGAVPGGQPHCSTGRGNMRPDLESPSNG